MKPEKRQQQQQQQQKNIKCNIIAQAYRSRCSSDTYQVIKTFHINDDFRFLFVERRISQPQPNNQASQE